jgi:phosphopantothenoylcysteine synthetase/decarboxylase
MGPCSIRRRSRSKFIAGWIDDLAHVYATRVRGRDPSAFPAMNTCVLDRPNAVEDVYFERRWKIMQVRAQMAAMTTGGLGAVA